MKRAILFLVIGAFAAGALAGCFPPQQTQPQQSNVSFMISGDPHEYAAYQDLVAAFEEANPDVKVELRYVPDDGEYRRRLAADLSANVPADIILLNYRRIADFAANGALEPLDSYLANSETLSLDNLFDPAVKAFQFADQQWCIPQNISSLVVYYNKNLFDAAGIPYPTNDWTWDDFLNAGLTLTADTNGDGVTDQYGAGIDPILYRLAPFIWQLGGELVDDPANPTQLVLDSPTALAAMQWFVDLQVKHHIVPDAAAEASESDESRFLNGTLGMFFDSRRGTPTMRTISDFDWDVAPLPNGSTPASILHSDGYCMTADSKDKEAAWRLIEFANAQTGQEVMVTTGRTVPSMRVVAESPAFLEPDNPPANSRVWVDVVPTLRQVPTMPGWVAVEDAASAEIERAFYGQASVEEAAAAAVARTREFFAPATQP
ncbi:MAG: sugar ABC transporter substrate-binding protein [Anaerolineae bacterium]|nr:sugar ABC transporter substrate-binding protein [Anaerolineae bacterium]MCB9142723.1 sugar ABC transporter substrate-binding protein [Anaerolineales bacterium]